MYHYFIDNIVSGDKRYLDYNEFLKDVRANNNYRDGLIIFDIRFLDKIVELSIDLHTLKHVHKDIKKELEALN